MNEISKCEVCDSSDLETILDLGSHPLCDDLKPMNSNLECKEYPIEILFCNNCYTCHQRFQVPKTKLFTKDYHYRARMTNSVLIGMKDFVNSCEQRLGNLKGLKVLDIGCNDGSLLNFFGKRVAKLMVLSQRMRLLTVNILYCRSILTKTQHD